MYSKERFQKLAGLITEMKLPDRDLTPPDETEEVSCETCRGRGYEYGEDDSTEECRTCEGVGVVDKKLDEDTFEERGLPPREPSGVLLPHLGLEPDDRHPNEPRDGAYGGDDWFMDNLDNEIEDIISRPGHVRPGGRVKHVGGDPTSELDVDLMNRLKTIDPKDEGLSTRDEPLSDPEYDLDWEHPDFAIDSSRAWPDIMRGE